MDAEAALAARAAETHVRIEALRRDLRRIMDSADTATDDEHDPEGTTAFDRAQTRSLLEAAQAQLAEIDAARDRLAAGTYGTCERCAGPIAAPRLAARPTARTCIGCAGR